MPDQDPATPPDTTDAQRIDAVRTARRDRRTHVPATAHPIDEARRARRTRKDTR